MPRKLSVAFRVSLALLAAGSLASAVLTVRHAAQKSTLAQLRTQAHQERADGIRRIIAVETHASAERVSQAVHSPTLYQLLRDQKSGSVSAELTRLAGEASFSAIWLYSPSGKVAYRYYAANWTKMKGWFPGKMQSERKTPLSESGTQIFYGTNHGVFFQVIGAWVSIPASLPTISGKWQLYTARIYDDAWLRNLSALTASRITIGSPHSLVPNHSSFEFCDVEKLADAEGAVVAQRFFIASSLITQKISQSADSDFHTGLLIIAALLLTSSFLLFVLIVHPLRVLISAIETRNWTKLNRYEHDKTELGSIAIAAMMSVELGDELEASNEELLMLNSNLEHLVEQRTAGLREGFEATMASFGTALEHRDQETKGHCDRVTALTCLLAHHMGFGAQEMDEIRYGALLHDIGKIAIPDAVLLKQGKLSAQEREIMESHALIGFQMLAGIPFFGRAIDIPYCHHERWDGTGYPRGLAGEEIPIAARIFAIADVWDALTSDRPYRAAWTKEQVMAHIAAASGSHFDPNLVRLFQRVMESESANRPAA